MKYWEKTKKFLGKISSYFPSVWGRKIVDIGSAAQEAIKGLTQYPPRVQDFLNRYGNDTISNITLRRAPIKGVINTLLNWISFGKWNEARRKYGYDTFYHLSMVFNVANTTAVLEKNQVINLSTGYNQQPDTEVMSIGSPANLTVNQLMDNTRKQMGDAKFFTYDAFTNNCQVFLMNVLKANNMLTPQAQSFIVQPIEQLVKELPSFVKPVARTLTDIAAVGDIALQQNI
jgi:hypothetical protein